VTVLLRLTVLPTSELMAGCRVAGARRAAGARVGRPGFGAWAGSVMGRMFRNPRRTPGRVAGAGLRGVPRGGADRRPAGGPERSWGYATMISQVQRSAAAEVRSFGQVQPRVCLNSPKMCSRSTRPSNACHHRSTSTDAAPMAELHRPTGLGSRSPGRCSTCSRIRIGRTGRRQLLPHSFHR